MAKAWLAGLTALALAGAASAQTNPNFIAGAPDWSAAKAHIDKAHKIAGADWNAAADYFCTPGVPPNRITDPAIAPTKLFDNVWALADSGTTVYAIVTPDGIILIDASYPQQTDTLLLPQMAQAGLDPAKVIEILVTHGHQDHYGGATYFQQKYGTKVAVSRIDWDVMANNKPVAGISAPKRDIEIEDGKAFTAGGITFTPVLVPGHTPGSLAFIFPVQDNGKPHMAALYGSAPLRADRLRPEGLVQEIGSWKKFAAVAKRMKVDVELQNHPLFDNMPAKLQALATRQSGQPNPFVVGAASYARFTETVRECLRSQIARKGGPIPN